LHGRYVSKPKALAAALLFSKAGEQFFRRLAKNLSLEELRRPGDRFLHSYKE